MEVDERKLLDWGARIGVQAKKEGVRRAQFEGILASLELSKDEKNSLLLTAAYAHRQAQRLRGRETARLINRALAEILRYGGGKSEARKVLGVAKWVYETVESSKVQGVNLTTLTFEKYLQLLRS